MKRNVKTEVRLSRSKDHYNLPLSEKQNRTHNIFLSLPYLGNINNNNRNMSYKNLKSFNSTHSMSLKTCFQDNKIKTILIDKKVSENLFNDISNNKSSSRFNSLSNTQYTGFFVIPKTEKTVSIEQVPIPITPGKSANSKNSAKKKKSNTDIFIYNKNFRFGNNKYSFKKKIPVGEIFKSRGVKFFKNKKTVKDFEVGGKFRSEEKDNGYMERNLFNENMKKIFEEESSKKIKKRRDPMNCREVLEFIKNDRCSKTKKLIKKTIEDKYKTKNNLHLFFKDFRKYCDEFDNWNNDDEIYI